MVSKFGWYKFKDGENDHLVYYDNDGLRLQIIRGSDNTFNSYKLGRRIEFVEPVEEFWKQFYPQAKPDI